MDFIACGIGCLSGYVEHLLANSKSLEPRGNLYLFTLIILAPFVAGPLADRIGRKWVLLSSSVFFVFAYILMMIASEIWILYLGRLIQGFGVGFVMTVQPMYVGEIATDAVRGATGSLMQLFIVCKYLLVLIIYCFFHCQIECLFV